ncbi:hypothetical protein NDU88_000843 [Pleurodeles waltl]|uniref:Uncharacterized protein n=1 Tax=Pleurodeles waltl TaxID=8319 RepID=A0AAV7Q1F0_PLEWA|nr:hypothetical protein NDU88_000843 [Pleurodeles waltl]
MGHGRKPNKFRTGTERDAAARQDMTLATKVGTAYLPRATAIDPCCRGTWCSCLGHTHLHVARRPRTATERDRIAAAAVQKKGKKEGLHM